MELRETFVPRTTSERLLGVLGFGVFLGLGWLLLSYATAIVVSHGADGGIVEALALSMVGGTFVSTGIAWGYFVLTDGWDRSGAV